MRSAAAMTIDVAEGDESAAAMTIVAAMMKDRKNVFAVHWRAPMQEGQEGMHGNEAEWKPVVEESRDARQRVQCHIKVGCVLES